MDKTEIFEVKLLNYYKLPKCFDVLLVNVHKQINQD